VARITQQSPCVRRETSIARPEERCELTKPEKLKSYQTVRGKPTGEEVRKSGKRASQLKKKERKEKIVFCIKWVSTGGTGLLTSGTQAKGGAITVKVS